MSSFIMRLSASIIEEWHIEEIQCISKADTTENSHDLVTIEAGLFGFTTLSQTREDGHIIDAEHDSSRWMVSETDGEKAAIFFKEKRVHHSV